MKTLADIKFYINRFKHNALNYIETILFNTYDFLHCYSENEFSCEANKLKFVLYKNKTNNVLNVYDKTKLVYKAVI